MKDSLQTIRSCTYRFFSGTLLSRITGMLRDVSMAYVFGTHPSIAAFMVAFRLAHLFRRLFGEGALQSAFIPEFESLRHHEEQRAYSFFRKLHLILTLFLVFVIGIGCSIAAILLKWGSLSVPNQDLVYLTGLMLPSLLFICLFGLNSSLLQCEKIYFIPSVAPVAFNLIWIIAVLNLQGIPTQEAMPRLAIGIVIACFFQWLLTLPQTWNRVRHNLDKTSFSAVDFRRWGKTLILGIFGVAATQINSAIDSLFARFAEPEGPAFLWYAIRIQQLPLALFGIAIAGAVLPPLSRAIKADQKQEYRDFLYDALARTWNFMLPITFAIFVLSDNVISFLYGRGDFDASSIAKTSSCLSGYSSGLLPAALVLVLAPAFYAQHRYFLPAIASFVSLLVNIFFNSVFIHWLQWGAVSVAFATSLSAWINLMLLGGDLFKGCMIKTIRLIASHSVSVSVSTFFAFLGTLYLKENPPIFFVFSSPFLQKFFNLTINASFYGGIFFICFFLMRSFPFSHLKKLISKIKDMKIVYLLKKTLHKKNTNC